MFYPEIDPVLLEIGPLAVRWYGLMYLLGFAGAWWLGRVRARSAAGVLNERQLEDLIFYGALGVILGGRVGYLLFYAFDAWLADPLALLRVWEGGMSFHGGMLGVIAAMWLLARKHGLAFWGVMDFVAPLAPIGLFTGRIGNFINGELWGAPGDVAWAMQVSCAGRADLCLDKLGLPYGTEFTPALHPTQLYEAGLEGLLLFLMLWLYSSRPRPVPSVSGLFLIGYGLFRSLVEYVRMPDAHIGYLAFDWLTMGQLLSLPMIIGGLALMWWARRHSATS